MRAYRLKKIEDLRRFMARVINLYDIDAIPGTKARNLGYLINILKDILTQGDLEVRIEAIEKELNGGLKK